MNFKDLKNSLVNAFLPPDKKEYENAVQKMVNAIKNQRSLYRKEMKDWKMARFHALSSEMPRRKKLIDLYEDILTDGFIYGRSETRKLRISNKGFIIKNKSGEIDWDKTRLLQKSWFNQFIKYAVESVYFGYSLVYPSKLDEQGFITNISLVYRDHVVPDTREILKHSYDTRGVCFEEPPYDEWCLWINNEGFLGLLDKAAPLYIFKKHSWQNWDEFEEMFGIPIRTAKVASTDKRVLAEVDKWLRDLGSAAYGRFPQDVEIDIQESKSRDSFNVFNEKRKAANEELATLFDGHSETAKDTGSRAKSGSIIESTQDLITADDETRVQFIVNDQLLPFLIKRGYPFAEDDQFEWNDNEKLSPKERLDIFKGVKYLGYKVKKEQIETELDVEIDGEIQAPVPPPLNPANRSGFNTPHAHYVRGAENSYRTINFDVSARLSDAEEEFLKQIYDNPDSVNWNYNEFKVSHEKLLQGLKEGYGYVGVDFDSEDHRTMQLFRSNIHRFATDKTQKEVIDLNNILKDPDVDSFSKFRDRAKKVFPNYKENWLQTEYDQAIATSQMGAKYQEMMQDADIAPFWRLRAVIDDGTTEICRGLDGKVFRKDDPDSFTFLPPNHWKCRSDAEDVLEGYDGDTSDMSDAIATDPDGWERMKKSGHNVNWGDAKQVFSEAQSYLAGLTVPPLSVDQLTFEAFGLKSFTALTQKAKMPTKTFDFDAAVDGSGMAKFIDVQGLPVWLSRDVFSLSAKQIQNAIEAALTKTNELYWKESGQGFVSTYFKHFTNGSLKITVYHSRTENATVETIELLENPDTERRGLLIYKAE